MFLICLSERKYISYFFRGLCYCNPISSQDFGSLSWSAGKENIFRKAFVLPDFTCEISFLIGTKSIKRLRTNISLTLPVAFRSINLSRHRSGFWEALRRGMRISSCSWELVMLCLASQNAHSLDVGYQLSSRQEASRPEEFLKYTYQL